MSLTRRILILFAAGAIGGPLGDLCHVISRTDGYPLDAARLPAIGLPYWVPVLFGTAGVAIGVSHPWVDGLISKANEPRPGLRTAGWVGAGLVFMLATWAASGFLPLPTGGSKDLVIGLCAVTAWTCFDRTWSGIWLGVLTGIMGTLSEITQVRAGIFFYLPGNQNLSGVPSWLPFLYFCASIGVGNLGRALSRGLIIQAKSAAPERSGPT